MEDTWGISGETFLGIYLLSFSCALLFAFAVRILTRSGAAASTTATPTEAPLLAASMSPQDIACLTGGPRRVVEAAVAQLVDTGQLRASRDGYLQVAHRQAGTDPVERTVLADVARHGRRSIAMLTNRLAGSDAVEEVAERLVRSGLLVDRELAARRKLIGMVPIVGVLAIGVVRWLAVIADDRPVGWLTGWLLASGLIAYAIHRRTFCPRTFEGSTALARVTVCQPAELVAAGGFASHPDQEIRESLLGRDARRRNDSAGVGVQNRLS